MRSPSFLSSAAKLNTERRGSTAQSLLGAVSNSRLTRSLSCTDTGRTTCAHPRMQGSLKAVKNLLHSIKPNRNAKSRVTAEAAPRGEQSSCVESPSAPVCPKRAGAPPAAGKCGVIHRNGLAESLLEFEFALQQHVKCHAKIRKPQRAATLPRDWPRSPRAGFATPVAISKALLGKAAWSAPLDALKNVSAFRGGAH